MGIGFGAVVGLGLADVDKNTSFFFPDLFIGSGGWTLYNRHLPKTSRIIAKLIYELPDRLVSHGGFILQRRVC